MTYEKSEKVRKYCALLLKMFMSRERYTQKSLANELNISSGQVQRAVEGNVIEHANDIFHFAGIPYTDFVEVDNRVQNKNYISHE